MTQDNSLDRLYQILTGGAESSPETQRAGTPARREEPTDSRRSRRGFLRKAAIVAPAAGLLAAASRSLGQTSGKGDAIDVNLVGTLFQIREHENDHVAFLLSALGSSARPKPSFTGLVQSDLQGFVRMATIFENIGVGAYLGAAPALAGTPYLTDALRIAAIEARHAGALNRAIGLNVGTQLFQGASTSFDVPFVADGVAQLVSPFVAGLNGGAPLTPLNSPLEVVNFALALEYLEAEFYNLNVPRFLGAYGS